MGRYKFGIASYNRADKQFMLAYLRGLGYERDDIIIQTQNKDDFDVYAEKFSGQATVLFKEGANVSENKNNLLDWYNANCDADSRLVLCSDKVRGVMYLGRDEKLHTMDREHLDQFLHRAFFVARQYGAALFGTYTVKNAFFMSHSAHINQFLLGCFMGVAKPGAIRFDPRLPLKEDWGVMLQTIANGGRVVRFNDIALDASFRTKGGCHDLWAASNMNEQCTQRLLATFPTLVRAHSTRQNELKYIGPTQRITKSILYM